MLTHKELKKRVTYNSKTGIFKCNIPNKMNRNAKKGDILGCSDSYGYLIISLNGKSYKAHRLAWFYEKGYMPENDIDHKDQIPYHNWIENLRETSKACNKINSKMHKNNTSGIVGLTKRKNSWEVGITVNKKQIYLGRFKSKRKAVETRWEAEKKYNFPNCLSNSSAFLYLK